MSNVSQAEQPWWQTLVGLLELAGRGASTPPFGRPDEAGHW